MFAAAVFFPGFDQLFMDGIELIGALGDDGALHRLFEPGPLEHRRFEQRGWRVGVVLQQFRRAPAVIAQVEPAVEAGVATAPALGKQRPARFRYLQTPQIFFIADHPADQFEAHRLDLGGGCLESPLDLVERERVIGPLVPIALAADGVKGEARAFGGGTPVVAFGTGDALHESAAGKADRMPERTESAALRAVRAGIGSARGGMARGR